MHIETFDDFLSTEHSTYYGDLPPFQFRKDKSDEGTLQWLTQNFDAAVKAAQSRMITYRRFHSLYKGIHWRSLDPRDYNRYDDDYGRRKPRMTVNFIWEMVDTKVSQRGLNKIAVAVMPNNNEQDDINNAQACKLLLDGRSEMIDLDKLQTDADRIMFVYGHVFMFVLWDENSGDHHPEYEKLMKKYPEGFPSSLTKKLAKAGVFRIGDVIVKVMGPDRVFPELGVKCKEDMDHIEYVEWVHIDKLKAEYPGLADKIKENQRQDFQYDLVDYELRKKFCMVRHFHHRVTPHHPTGEYIKYTDDVILERKKLGYSHGKLPFVEDRDIEVYGEYWGRSFLTNIEQLNRHYNNIESAIARNESVGSAPKWMMPKGAAKISSLNNEFTVVEYTGMQAPQLVTPKHTNSQAFEQQERIEKKIAQHSKVYDITRGEVPPGVTANSALRFLDEQASQRDSSGVARRKKRVLDVYRMMLEVMGQYYDETDNRTVRMLGKDNDYLIKSLKKADFSKTYDVKLLNSSALPDTKTGKISTIVDINAMTQTDPVFRREEIIQMMDLGMDDTFKNEATIAVTAAKTVIDKILNRESDIPEPTEYDNFLVHYDMFNRTLQSTTYRTSVDDKTKEVFKQHIMVMEGLMLARAKKNKAFAIKLQMLDMYPMFFNPPAGETLDMIIASFAPPQAPPVAGPEMGSQQLDTGRVQESVDKAIEREQGE